MRKYRFFYYFNKPASISADKPMWSVHFRKKCLLTENIVCHPGTMSKSNKRQPYAVMQGFSKGLFVGLDCIIIL